MHSVEKHTVQFGCVCVCDVHKTPYFKHQIMLEALTLYGLLSASHMHADAALTLPKFW